MRRPQCRRGRTWPRPVPRRARARWPPPPPRRPRPPARAACAAAAEQAPVGAHDGGVGLGGAAVDSGHGTVRPLTHRASRTCPGRRLRRTSSRGGSVRAPPTIEGVSALPQLIVSTHFDDAVLSVAHVLQHAKGAATVVTVCGGAPPREVDVSDWDRGAGFSSGWEPDGHGRMRIAAHARSRVRSLIRSRTGTAPTASPCAIRACSMRSGDCTSRARGCPLVARRHRQC